MHRSLYSQIFTPVELYTVVSKFSGEAASKLWVSLVQLGRLSTYSTTAVVDMWASMPSYAHRYPRQYTPIHTAFLNVSTLLASYLSPSSTGPIEKEDKIYKERIGVSKA